MADSHEPGGEPQSSSSRVRGEGAGSSEGEPDVPDTDAEKLGPAPEVQGADRIRSALRARMFGDDPEPTEEPTPASLEESQLGPAPQVQGAERIRSALRARLFGSDDGSEALPHGESPPSASGVIGGMDTEPGDGRRRSSSNAEPELAGHVGRFRVLDRLGSGGMGVVFSAYDPELDRKVAIKLLRPDVREGLAQRDAHARLLREAQAMARLSDPNVIVVHEVGAVDDRVFVAMEFIDGMTLGEWLSADKRPWREVLDVFIKAGSGLAAAHRADLVHRDFKPDNVLLGHEGQVRVVDFGLARSLGEEAKAAPSVRESLRERPELDTLNTPLTRTGAVMGTPAYMSPEQYLGNPANAASDQFSFCVALYEGLFGMRPFGGTSLANLAANVTAGKIRETPSDARVPKRLLNALRRGLSPDPADRYASIEDLLVELRRDPARRWRWGGLIAGVVAVTSLATFAATSGPEASDACTKLDAQLEGVWDDEARAAVTEAIEATGTDFAPRVAATTVRLLDGHTQEWVSMAEDACGAALVAQKDDSEHERRSQCLDQRLAEVGALVEALRESDAGMAEAAVKATSGLTTGLAACSDPRRLAAYEVVEDPAMRQQLADAYARLAKAKALGSLGHYAQAEALATDVIEQARQARVAPLEALGLFTRGGQRERTGDEEGSESDLRQAVALAERSGDPGTRALALTTLIYVVAKDPRRYEEAIRLGDQARAVLDYIDADPLLFADLDSSLGFAELTKNNLEASLALHRRSHKLRTEVLGEDHPDIGRSLLNMGISLKGSDAHLREAEAYLRQALESLEQNLGSHHPLVGTATINLGNCLARQERFEDAIPFQRRALEIFKQAFGADHAATLRAVFNLGKINFSLRRFDEAAELFARGLAARQRELAPDDLRLAGWMSHLARSQLELNKHAEAADWLEQSLKLRAVNGQLPVIQARDRFRLALALTPSDLPRARQQALSAREALQAEHDAKPNAAVASWLEKIDAWLAEHPAQQ
ncbi:MAG: serine/threonine-protein kinase [Myxococcota bacterium]